MDKLNKRKEEPKKLNLVNALFGQTQSTTGGKPFLFSQSLSNTIKPSCLYSKRCKGDEEGGSLFFSAWLAMT